MSFIVPNECVRYLRWQRSRFMAAITPDPLEVKRQYVAMIETEFAAIEPFLPECVESIIDIGCGMAGIDVLLARKYPQARIALLDGSDDNIVDTDTPRETGVGGWNKNLRAYNSREHTELLLAANGVTVDRWYDVGTTELLQADLIVSLGSCGFHYPYDTYRKSGFVICDLRLAQERQRLTVLPHIGGRRVAVFPKAERWAWKEAA